ncbi:MAG: hypothetical protein KID04_15625 [Clostridium sp.]|uniref:hypothetical protein n=1 Tax=Clostridium sp. (strain MSTE9) TaxID=1105031 RepID=UPI0012DD7168|nr:hypothetical protein [Clostridium sp. MSTE9]MBS5784292.1 hypothetical protein [Clostridium sp.]
MHYVKRYFHKISLPYTYVIAVFSKNRKARKDAAASVFRRKCREKPAPPFPALAHPPTGERIICSSVHQRENKELSRSFQTLFSVFENESREKRKGLPALPASAEMKTREYQKIQKFYQACPKETEMDLLKLLPIFFYKVLLDQFHANDNTGLFFCQPKYVRFYQ